MRNLYCVCGRSASGKTATVKCIEKQYGTKRVRPWTTRSPRYEGENDYVFVTPEQFHAQNDIIAYGVYDGHEYGVPVSELKNYDIYILELSGIKQLLEEYKDKPIQVIYFDALEALCLDRMQGRGDTPESIKRRMKIDRHAFSDALRYANYVFPVEYGNSVEHNAKMVYEAICTKETHSANQELRERFPGVEACIFMSADNCLESKPTYTWKCDDVYSPEFNDLEEAFEDICLYLSTPHLRELNQIDGNTEDAKYLLTVGKAALPLCHQYTKTGDEKYLQKFAELFPEVDTEALYNGEDDLLATPITRKQRESVEEAFGSTEYLVRKINGLPVTPEEAGFNFNFGGFNSEDI